MLKAFKGCKSSAEFGGREIFEYFFRKEITNQKNSIAFMRKRPLFVLKKFNATFYNSQKTNDNV
jgi:hypothetical protein